MCSLTNLPLSIQSRILSYLCPHEALYPRNSRWKPPFSLSFRDPPVTISLACAETLTVMLPSELLSPAQASPILAAAAANLLASRVSYLTAWNTANRLAEWVTAYAPYVKAVSTWEPFGPNPNGDWEFQFFPNSTSFPSVADSKTQVYQVLERQNRGSIPLFKALSTDAVTLEVLDLTGVPFMCFQDMKDELLGGLCSTLESNSATLRELALPVSNYSDITEKALEMSTLKKLDVLALKRFVLTGNPLLPEIEGNRFMRMIRAVDGHADRTRKLSTLSELRLFGPVSLPSKREVMRSDGSVRVFHVIKTLRINRCSCMDRDSFVSLFRNLERLFLGGTLSPQSVGLGKVCRRMLEVHLRNIDRITSLPVGEKEHRLRKKNLGANQNFEMKDGIYLHVRNSWSRSIKTVEMGIVEYWDGVQLMRCPKLEYLSQFLSFENAFILTVLLRECKQMKALELVIYTEHVYCYFNGRRYRRVIQGRCSVTGWRSLSRAIPQSHKNLCQLAISMHPFEEPVPVECVESAVDCFEKMVRAIGARATRLSFRVNFERGKHVLVLEQLCRLLEVFIQYTPALESLELDFQVGRHKPKVGGWKWDDGLVNRLFDLRNKLLRKIPSLRMLDLGIWHGLSKPLERDDDGLKIAPAPVHSARESTGK